MRLPFRSGLVQIVSHDVGPFSADGIDEGIAHRGCHAPGRLNRGTQVRTAPLPTTLRAIQQLNDAEVADAQVEPEDHPEDRRLHAYHHPPKKDAQVISSA